MFDPVTQSLVHGCALRSRYSMAVHCVVTFAWFCAHAGRTLTAKYTNGRTGCCTVKQAKVYMASGCQAEPVRRSAAGATGGAAGASSDEDEP